MPLTLYPAPRQLTETDAKPPPRDARIILTHDADLPVQGYRLHYAEPISISYADSAGLRYAQQTLDQLRAAPAHQQRAVTVDDWPDFTRRVFMLDISRDRVPTRASLRRLVDLLVLSRYNQLELYTEHTFAYSGHSEVWQDASPLTAADLRWLDDLCAGHEIELVPNQNTFGHWERWLAHETYLPLAENPKPQEFAGTVRPPSTLAPTEGNAQFVTGLLEELSSHVRSQRINIGADETWELGTGASRERAERDGLGTVFLDYVEKVAEPWTSQGRTVEFWADILGNYPELMDRIPEGMVPVVWLYDSPENSAAVLDQMSEAEHASTEAHGVETEQLRDFASRASALIEAGVPFWVAPGTGTWLSFTGRLDNALSNMRDAARTGTQHNSEGFLLTCWGDHGHYDPLVIAYAPILFGGGVSWNIESSVGLEETLAELLNGPVFQDEAEVLGEVLVCAGRVADSLDATTGNSSPLFRAVQHAGDLEPHHIPSSESLAAARETLSTALEKLQHARPASPEGPAAVAETRQALRWAHFGAELLDSELMRSGLLASRHSDAEAARSGAAESGQGGHGQTGSGPEHGDDGTRITAEQRSEARQLLEQFEALCEGQRRAWLISSRPGGLETSIGRFARLRRVLTLLAHASPQGGSAIAPRSS